MVSTHGRPGHNRDLGKVKKRGGRRAGPLPNLGACHRENDRYEYQRNGNHARGPSVLAVWVEQRDHIHRAGKNQRCQNYCANQQVSPPASIGTGGAHAKLQSPYHCDPCTQRRYGTTRDYGTGDGHSVMVDCTHGDTGSGIPAVDWLLAFVIKRDPLVDIQIEGDYKRPRRGTSIAAGTLLFCTLSGC